MEMLADIARQCTSSFLVKIRVGGQIERAYAQEGSSERSPLLSLSMMPMNQQQIEGLVKSCLLRKAVQSL